MRKKYPIIAKGEISFYETGTDMVFAYRRKLEEQEIVVFCNLGEKEQKIKLDTEFHDFRVLLENYKAQKVENTEYYTMKPYEFLVLANKKIEE